MAADELFSVLQVSGTLAPRSPRRNCNTLNGYTLSALVNTNLSEMENDDTIAAFGACACVVVLYVSALLWSRGVVRRRTGTDASRHRNYRFN
ncbi:hypothetical protein K1T71_005342 [Dendrolimus kikuchii]|uniref:Uncharacterized protein n=1 Tax=Dendrolimus kikuchii TaxID=765133 RepID=A0ACC1D762_9NEOP|nr:hypothetical protein K1T71_005342 [Dendrolimus kikuchii]